jgi:hypothetical protein
MTETNESMQPSKRERVKTLIRALLAKTVANGCTHDEALKAAAKASELMATYDLTYEDAQQVRDDIYGLARKQYARTSRHHEATGTWRAITELTGTRCYFDGPAIVFFGQKQDTELAHFLMDTFIASSETEWQAFRKRNKFADTSIRGRKSFMRGIVGRINERLGDIRRAREAEQAAVPEGSRALVLLKNQIVNDRYAPIAKELRLISRGTRRVGANNLHNYEAGRKSGDRVSITTGIGASAPTRIA